MFIPFFPNTIFAWLAYVLLLLLLAMAACIDWKRFRIPNELVLVVFGCGVLMNLLRGIGFAMMGSDGPWLGWSGGFLVVVECLLESLAGFGLAFVIFFVLWQMGVHGAGDVKLFAATGSWVGPMSVLWLLLGEYVAVIIVLILYRGTLLIMGKKPSRHLSYSLPLFLAVLVMMGFRWRMQLFPLNP